jgi:AraC family ethanolamine operon transcriptional activator
MFYSCRQSFDVNDHAALLPQWAQRYEQVSAGSFQGRLETLSLGTAQLFRETTDQAVLQTGRARPGSVTLGVPIGAGGEAWYLGRHLKRGQPLAVVAGQDFELASRGSFDVVAISVDMGELSDHALRVNGQPFDASEHGGALFQDDEHSQALAALVLDTLAAARTDAGPLSQAPAQRVLKQAMFDTMLCHLAVPQAGCATEGTVATRQRVVREARTYMASHAEEPITVPELCEALHVSRRTLQYSFQDVLGMTPVAYLRALRLNGVRRDLRRGSALPVADCAARWGFWHLSRFAADYRHLFGELPSVTLKRSRGE